MIDVINQVAATPAMERSILKDVPVVERQPMRQAGNITRVVTQAPQMHDYALPRNTTGIKVRNSVEQLLCLLLLLLWLAQFF